MRLRPIWLLLLLSATLSMAQTNVLGTAVDATSELPIPKVRIFSADSTFLGSSDAQGRFELRLRRPIEVTFRREGYKDKLISLADVSDLLDLSVALDPLGSALEGRTVTGHNTVAAASSPGSIAALESVGGMRMDLQEHLRNLPGVSNVREFSSEVSVYGCRTADVTHILGPFQIPNLRHLDFSFPGNQSVLNPRMLQGITVEHDPTSGPLEQGLASALRYQPLRPATDHQEGVVSVGLTNREIDAFGPIGNGTYALSGRWLDPSLMNHLASRFFVGSSDQDASSAKKDTSSTAKSTIDLQSFDGYLRVEQGLGDFALSLTALGSTDAHSVKLYAQRGDGTMGYIPIQKGNRSDGIVFGELQGETGLGWLDGYGGVVYGTEATQLSDTLLRDSLNVSTESDWSAWTRDRTDSRAGFTLQPSWSVLGLEPEILAAYDLIDDSRSYGRTFKGGIGIDLDDDRQWLGAHENSDDLQYSRLHGLFRLRHKDGESRWGGSVGVLWAQGADAGPEATLSWMGPALGVGWTANISLRQSDDVQAVGFSTLGVHSSTAEEAKLGAGRRLGPVEVTSTVYWRKLQNPQLPQADFLWLLPQSRKANSAEVLGGTLQAKWTTWHTVQIQSNFSRVKGTYDLADGGTMAWDANRDFDAWTVVKIHPRSDTLFSIILSHCASLGKPAYRYMIDTSARSLYVEEDSTWRAHPSYADQFRTDVRLELDIPTDLAPMRSIRFYAEVQNIFGQFSADWARWLGGDNFRQRSWTPIRYSESTNTYGSKGTLVGVKPLYARGTDLMVSFGVEGRLGI